MKFRDLSSIKVGMLYILEKCASDNGSVWLCQCDCGNYVKRKSGALVKALNNNYQKTSCGCQKNARLKEIDDAIKSGMTRYFTGKPCQKGHIDFRYVSTRGCVECAKERDIIKRPERLTYMKEYQKRNPEKVRAWNAKTKEKNKEKIQKYHAERRSLPEVKKARAEYERARRQNIRAGGGIIKKSDIDSIIASQHGKCAFCKTSLKKFHVDHITPLKLGGKSDLFNLQVLCPKCNLSKGAKHPIDWAQEKGMLL